jgi:gluconokinase
MIIVIIGVSGSGKTTVGKAVAHRLGWPFHDADDYHPPANVARMTAGVALTDEDREPWLATLREVLLALDRQQLSAVLACSALKNDFRRRLRKGVQDLSYVYLRADRELIRRRLTDRKGHFMPATLVDSQFEALEEPEDAIVLDAHEPLEVLVSQVVKSFRT